ncbi:FecR family protein [Flagellimonas crocea]|uniref:FecR family protein n=1 Tax=Flagellimonas crocea TaxID=3067311 RepID=UPI00296FDB25|nr:FecR domain-containing protein [Muricauda sp. DH64]
MKKYLDGTISKKEESLLEQFDHRLLSKNHRNIFKNPEHKKQIGQKLTKGINRPQTRNLMFKWSSVAASIILLVGLTYFVFNYMGNQEVDEPVAQVTKSTDWGQKLNLHLADGTEVYLNSGSTIIFPKRFDGNIREVQLEGEAFFDVAKNPNKPFIIKSGEVETTVLGTSFNVNTYPDSQQVAITVATGKVKVASQDNEVFLLPNEQGVFDKRTKSITKDKIDISAFLHWKDGIIHFEDAQLSEVLETLERWYGVSFLVDNDNIGNCHITATYNNERLSAVLESIVYAKKGLSYQFMDNNNIQLNGKCTD